MLLESCLFLIITDLEGVWLATLVYQQRKQYQEAAGQLENVKGVTLQLAKQRSQ